MNEQDAVLVYSGDFGQDIIKSMLKYAEEKLESSGIDDLVRRKIFNVMVEMLQNISKHQFVDDKSGARSIFILVEKENDFQLITGNPIRQNIISDVKSRIDRVNNMDDEELKIYYKETRLASRISEVGGAGLGFIDIARKSGNKIEFETFSLGSDQYDFFTLKTRINKNN